MNVHAEQVCALPEQSAQSESFKLPLFKIPSILSLEIIWDRNPPEGRPFDWYSRQLHMFLIEAGLHVLYFLYFLYTRNRQKSKQSVANQTRHFRNEQCRLTRLEIYVICVIYLRNDKYIPIIMSKTQCEINRAILQNLSGFNQRLPPCHSQYVFGQPGGSCVGQGLYSLGYINTYPKLRNKQHLCAQTIASMVLCSANELGCGSKTLYPLSNARYDGCQGCGSCQTSNYNNKV